MLCIDLCAGSLQYQLSVTHPPATPTNSHLEKYKHWRKGEWDSECKVLSMVHVSAIIIYRSLCVGRGAFPYILSLCSYVHNTKWAPPSDMWCGAPAKLLWWRVALIYSPNFQLSALWERSFVHLQITFRHPRPACCCFSCWCCWIAFIPYHSCLRSPLPTPNSTYCTTTMVANFHSDRIMYKRSRHSTDFN